MDKRDWSWLPSHMPTVASLVREKKKKYGEAHVNECWKRGVLQREPGWFFAIEGSLALGVPDDDQRLAWLASLKFTNTQALLDMREPGGANGQD